LHLGQLTYTQADQPKVRIARLYLRASTDEQDLTRQAQIEQSTRAAGYYVAGIYKEKASGARADRPELLRMIRDLQPEEVVVCERIDRLSRLPLAEAEQLVASIRGKGAKLAVPGLVDRRTQQPINGSLHFEQPVRPSSVLPNWQAVALVRQSASGRCIDPQTLNENGNLPYFINPIRAPLTAHTLGRRPVIGLQFLERKL
jgi:hypothetical protein